MADTYHSTIYSLCGNELIASLSSDWRKLFKSEPSWKHTLMPNQIYTEIF